MEIIIVILIIVIAAISIKNYKDKKNITNTPAITQNLDNIELTSEPTEKLPYRRKYLLTKNEAYFYKQLKVIADEYGYCVLAKVRLADLIETNNEIEDREKLKYFNKIASKHIDFVLCNPENLYVEYLIELDDNSHNNSKRIERDIFIEKVIEKSGYTLIRVYSAAQIKDKITNKNAITP